MIQTINVSQFRDAFRSMGRQDQFSYEGLGALFDYLEDFDGGGYDLDVIALCCDFSEDTVEDIAANYGLEFSSIEDGDTDGEREHARAYLEENTTIVAETASGFLYAQF
jgi:hypothetical protein